MDYLSRKIGVVMALVPPHGLLGGGLIPLLDFMGKMDREGRVHD
ncbi:hypothetical protein POD11_02360 [Acinetobacter sp. P1(2023)]|nr:MULTISPECIES: hypothetical protein [Acinetobacter]MCG9481053.1 hypothetical protein [Acinetobacter pittii]MCU4502139.1 hypothetical protein [Acinetobacter sp. WU_MDCI_Abxe161]MCU4529016.1 hypothetical protein [Acinetobacter sp. WU_MDCI_Abxe169]MDC0841101.1 hypothetical protein [Acinetobacter sp. P1(2023)]